MAVFFQYEKCSDGGYVVGIGVRKVLLMIETSPFRFKWFWR
jgi:hypothetical protein